jgi:hypothetical protein
MTKSSYISTDPMGDAFGRQSMLNNLSAFTRPNYQNDRLSSLIEAKRSTGFDSQKTPTLSNDEWNNEGSRIRMF